MTDERCIVTAGEIADMEGTPKTHFLNPRARRVNRSLGDATGLTGIGFHIIDVAPGDETTEHHRHHHEDECVYVLSGQATAVIGETEHAIGPGDFIGYRKGGAAHSIRNTGTEVLRCIVVGARAAHDVCEYPRAGRTLYRNAGRWDLVEDGHIERLGGGVGRK